MRTRSRRGKPRQRRYGYDSHQRYGQDQRQRQHGASDADAPPRYVGNRPDNERQQPHERLVTVSAGHLQLLQADKAKAEEAHAQLLHRHAELSHAYTTKAGELTAAQGQLNTLADNLRRTRQEAATLQVALNAARLHVQQLQAELVDRTRLAGFSGSAAPPSIDFYSEAHRAIYQAAEPEDREPEWP